MNRLPPLRTRALSLGVLLLPFFVACGEDASDGSDESGGSGGTGAVVTASGGSAGKGGSAGSSGSSAGKGGSGGSSGSSSGKGGSTSAGKGGGTSSGGSSSGTSGTSAEGGSGNDTSSEGGMGAADMYGGAPGATEEGLSPYAPDCDEMVPCTTPGVTCLGVRLDEGGHGFTCSNQCDDVTDCSSADSGAEATPGCVQFTSAARCVLVCYDNGEERSCPTGMECYRYPNFPVGYCLWL